MVSCPDLRQPARRVRRVRGGAGALFMRMRTTQRHWRAFLQLFWSFLSCRLQHTASESPVGPDTVSGEGRTGAGMLIRPISGLFLALLGLPARSWPVHSRRRAWHAQVCTHTPAAALYGVLESVLMKHVCAGDSEMNHRNSKKSLEPSEAKKRLHSEREEGAASGDAFTVPASNEGGNSSASSAVTSESTHGIQKCPDSNTFDCCLLSRGLKLHNICPHICVKVPPPEDWKVVNVQKINNMYDIQFQHPEISNNSTYQGHMEGDKAHGIGTFTATNGDTYEGFWKDGKRNGQGIFTRLSDTHTLKYEGCFQDSFPHGQGTLTSSLSGTYEGEWKRGNRHGQGKQTLPCGCTYEGTFSSNQISGQGILIPAMGGSADVYQYVGEFVEGKYQGKGKLTSWTGSEYVGEFVKGKKHGHGTITSPDHGQWGNKYVGEWQNDRKQGKGIMTSFSADGFRDEYDGSWSGNKRHGWGKQTSFILPDECRQVYEGDWFYDMRHGYGMLEDWDKRSYYKGEFVSSKMHGHGILEFKDPEKMQDRSTLTTKKYEGAFEKDEMHGFGRLLRRDGTTYEGAFQKGKKHGVGKIIKADGSSAGLGRWENDVYQRMLHNTVSVDNPEQAYPVCTICAAAPVDMVVYPCAHMHFCSTCIDQWLNHWKKTTCPSCKEHVTGTQRVFLP